MKILAFGASTSSKSINQTLANYAAKLVDSAEVKEIKLSDYELPIYSEDMEKEIGHPEAIKQFLNEVSDADALVISFAEHNGSYSTAFKNLFDWCSRVEAKVFQGKPVVVLSASPGPNGAKVVLEQACNMFPYFDGEVKSKVSIPSFYDNFDLEKNDFKNKELADSVKTAVSALI